MVNVTHSGDFCERWRGNALVGFSPVPGTIFVCVCVDSLEKTLMLGKIEGRRRRGQQRMRQLDSIIDTMDMSLSKLQEIVKNREARHAGHKELDNNK